MPNSRGIRVHSAFLSVALMGTLGCGEFAPASAGSIMGAGRRLSGSLVATAESEVNRRTGGAADEKSKTRKRAVVRSALYLVAGIALLGVLLIVVVVLWGIRLRQRNRKGTPSEAPFDPLWYLRKRKGNPPPPPAATDADPDTDRTT